MEKEQKKELINFYRYFDIQNNRHLYEFFLKREVSTVYELRSQLFEEKKLKEKIILSLNDCEANRWSATNEYINRLIDMASYELKLIDEILKIIIDKESV